ncbi:PREDICTED: F-box/LRR-repeat protein At3g59250-like isoform X1 [Camelina sativa]|uniref:F-box/LRR-repeat protein At3g59250-like isoform X1 n=1 Tax=Camelina sativa TaxID=90675 RepID=A0ABM1RRQ4_CAMSA|nr:PREDICTED: F-box/LRR-repeat protein At3g59250-like isoform X1 [Camelina sativa]XP_019101692.1 PREDICTED: F-box/LRR-repeat protein At3g59250-like isoform X1 [Camelina sativa]
MSRDIISGLPEALLCHILSFLPIEDSALTSLLSKKWRYLFAFRPNLDFDGSVYLKLPQELFDYNEMDRMIRWSFVDFVNRVLELQGDSTVNRFSLMFGHGVVRSEFVNEWISNVLRRGVNDLDLRISLHEGRLPSKIFESKSLVRLRIESGNVYGIDLEHVSLLKLKTLYLTRVMLGDSGDCFHKLTSGCHVLEELLLIRVYSDLWNRSLSSNSLKRLTLHPCGEEYDHNPDTVSFDTPNLVYFDYSDYIARKYPKVDFGSLVEATIDLGMTRHQYAHANYENLVGNASDLLKGICNVKILYLSASTLEVLTFCCKPVPVFNSLIHLTVETHNNVGWESLPTLLKKCPNLETLVFDGFHHKYTIKCGDVDGCLCKFSGEVPTCLSSSPVKALKVLRFGETGIENQIELIKHFLETMPRLEKLTVHYDTSIDDDLIKVSSQLNNFAREASPNCEIHVISDRLLN